MANVCSQVAKQTQKLHAENLLHFDLKPRNILYKGNASDIILCDMDASMSLGELRSQDAKPGSDAYYAPEVS